MTIKTAIQGATKLVQAQFINHDAESLHRLQICQVCPHNRNGRCGICGCILDAKVKIKTESCPQGNW